MGRCQPYLALPRLQRGDQMILGLLHHDQVHFECLHMCAESPDHISPAESRQFLVRELYICSLDVTTACNIGIACLPATLDIESAAPPSMRTAQRAMPRQCTAQCNAVRVTACVAVAGYCSRLLVALCVSKSYGNQYCWQQHAAAGTVTRSARVATMNVVVKSRAPRPGPFCLQP